MTQSVSVETYAVELIDELPQEIRDIAARHVKQSDDARWCSGELSAQLVDELSDRVPKSALRMAVSILYETTEATVRDRERLYRLVPPGLREAHPLLGYHHWRAASYAKVRTDNPADYDMAKQGALLDIVYQIEQYHEAYGRKPTVAQCYEWAGGKETRAALVWMRRAESIMAHVEKMIADKQTPPVVVAELREILSRLDTLLSAYDII